MNDIADEVFSLGGDDVELQMQELTDKVSAIKHAKRKYNMDADELVDYLDECRDELAELSTADDEIELLTEKKRSLAEEVKSLAEGLSERRKKLSGYAERADNLRA